MEKKLETVILEIDEVTYRVNTTSQQINPEQVCDKMGYMVAFCSFYGNSICRHNCKYALKKSEEENDYWWNPS